MLCDISPVYGYTFKECRIGILDPISITTMGSNAIRLLGFHGSRPQILAEERRKPAGKLQLPAPVVDALPTPDSELEDAATLAHAIIASELHTPTVTSPSPPAPPATSPFAPDDVSRLSVKGPEVPTPPVSLSQIGVKPKPSTAAQIESSLTKTEPKSVETEAPKKKVVKKVKSKESASSEAPVPPPRKKEKKPK